MGTTFIYALAEQTGEIRYVGKSDNPQKRYKRHLGLFENKPTHKSRWIKSLLEKNEKPNLLILEEVDSSEWEIAEKKWISHFRSMGNKLTNTLDGGQGGATITNENITEQERERRRELGRKRFTEIWRQIREERR